MWSKLSAVTRRSSSASSTVSSGSRRSLQLSEADEDCVIERLSTCDTIPSSPASSPLLALKAVNLEHGCFANEPAASHRKSEVLSDAELVFVHDDGLWTETYKSESVHFPSPPSSGEGNLPLSTLARASSPPLTKRSKFSLFHRSSSSTSTLASFENDSDKSDHSFSDSRREDQPKESKDAPTKSILRRRPECPDDKLKLFPAGRGLGSSLRKMLGKGGKEEGLSVRFAKRTNVWEYEEEEGDEEYLFY
eukprot:CAMPEP_0196720982 /NCGR_PEP_ID=MMETSP1091-20130531/3659_1 /TAXON_ID=302021 /ORGANISM="Rhodomonas sp., Strain CCMP768" /LENGTH=248 /DNA_ID=CAMNT_0042062343 /DNA_START=86 /DNA_END=832 /DNA_ORIENTATION=+